MAVSAAALKTGEASPAIIAGPKEIGPNPQETEGFLLAGEDGSVVRVEVKNLGEEAYRGGTTQLEEYTFTTVLGENQNQPDDTYQYRARTNIPNDLRSDTLLLSTTPWTTRDGGFNQDVMSQFNNLGYATMFVEPRGSSIKASLIDSANNINHIGQILGHKLAKTDLRPDELLYFGASRAAAIGLGVTGVKYADLLAPCFVVPGRWQDLPKHALQLGWEGVELGKHVLSLDPDEAIDHRKTFSAHPMDFVHTVLAIPQLMNGDAGKLFWTNSAEAVHITTFDKDGWSHPDEIAQMVADKINMYIRLLKGRHLTLANPEVIQGPVARFDAMADMRGFDGDFSIVDFDEIMQTQPPIREKDSPLGRLSLGTVIKAAYNLALTS